MNAIRMSVVTIATVAAVLAVGAGGGAYRIPQADTASAAATGGINKAGELMALNVYLQIRS